MNLYNVGVLHSRDFASLYLIFFNLDDYFVVILILSQQVAATLIEIVDILFELCEALVVESVLFQGLVLSVKMLPHGVVEAEARKVLR